jgi:transcriptional regulator PpsR
MQPDIKLVLDPEGVIRQVVVANDMADEPVDDWLGMHWWQTVGEVDSQRVTQFLRRAMDQGTSPFFQVTQRFPSGLDVPVEYMAVRFDEHEGLLAIGRDVRAVAQLQSRLAAAQQTMERGSWRLREVETRYRALFESSNDAMLVMRIDDFGIIEANPAAIVALGLAAGPEDDITGRDLLAEIAAADQATFQAAVIRAVEQGQAPRILVHLGPDADSWLIRLSSLVADETNLVLVQLHPAGDGRPREQGPSELTMLDLVDRSPEGYAVLDERGTILRANAALLELIQAGGPGAVVGENLGRWLGPPGGDMTMLLELLRSNGMVRVFPGTIVGELDMRTEVEISAVISTHERARYIGVCVRDVSRRLDIAEQSVRLGGLLESMTKQLGSAKLKSLVASTVGLVERHYIEAALGMTGGNRTAAARVLGISRQSLYIKLARYGIEHESEPDAKA